MKILTISYGKTVNLGNFESCRLDATAQVDPGETPEDTLAKLREWVEGQAEQERAARKASEKGWKA